MTTCSNKWLFTAALCGMSVAAVPAAHADQRDDQLEERIENRFDDQAGLEDVDVEVEQGTVTLSGTVQDEATRQRAEQAVGKMGGKRVNNEIEVAGAAAAAGGAEDPNGVGEEISDAWITTKIKTQYLDDDILDEADISVNTESEGVVTLSGTVPSEAARKHAEDVARGTEGVRKVNNTLEVVKAGDTNQRERSQPQQRDDNDLDIDIE